jgi:hypothetical protein
MADPQPQEIQFCQIVITNQQAYLLGVAADEAASSKGISEQAKDNLERLSVFMYDVSTDPENYPVRTLPAMAQVKSIFKAAKGPAQPQTRKNKRKERQAQRQGFAKRRRRERQVQVAAFNAKLADLMELKAQYELAEEWAAEVYGVKIDNTLVEKIRETEQLIIPGSDLRTVSEIVLP